MPELKSFDTAEKTITLFSRFISRTMGLHFGRDRLPELGRKIAAAAGEFGFDDPEACMLWLMSAPPGREQMEILTGALTIGETYFFRDPESYRVLEEHVLAGLISARRDGEKRLRIWSAGCSSGEEPYSIAILLSRLLPDVADWSIMLLATDINPGAIEKGRQGIYGQWSFRNAPPWLMDYFKKRKDGRFEIIPKIRKMVQFSYLNMAEDCYPSLFNNTNALDVIFCRNVVLYFGPEMINKVMAKLHHALQGEGWLFVSPTEAVRRSFDGFVCRRFPGAHVYQKESEIAADPLIHSTDLATGLPATASSKPVWQARCSVPPAESSMFRISSDEPAAGLARADSRETADDGGQLAPLDVVGQARVLYESGEYEQAACKANEFLASGGSGAEAVILLAKAYANLGRFSEARESFEAAIAADRLRAANYYLLAMILQEEGRPEEAAATLNQALYVDHDYVPAYFALGNLNLQAGRKNDAQRNFTNALRQLEKMNPHDPVPEADGLTAGRLSEIIRTMYPGRTVNE